MNPPSPCTGSTTTHAISCSARSDGTSSSASSEVTPRYGYGPRARRQVREPPADLHVRLVDPDHEALMEVGIDLFVHGCDGSGQAVAGVLAAEPAGEIHVGLAVDVLDAGALGAGDDDRRGRDP